MVVVIEGCPASGCVWRYTQGCALVTSALEAPRARAYCRRWQRLSQQGKKSRQEGWCEATQLFGNNAPPSAKQHPTWSVSRALSGCTTPPLCNRLGPRGSAVGRGIDRPSGSSSGSAAERLRCDGRRSTCHDTHTYTPQLPLRVASCSPPAGLTCHASVAVSACRGRVLPPPAAAQAPRDIAVYVTDTHARTPSASDRA